MRFLSRHGSALLSAVTAFLICQPLQSQTFTFGPRHVITPNPGFYRSPLDLNGDGKIDLYVEGSDGRSIYLGNGDGTFASTPISVAATSFHASPTFVDVNGDGLADMVFAYAGNSDPNTPYDFPGAFGVALGDGKGNFTVTTRTPLDYGQAAFVPGDFNHDGKVDFAIVVAGQPTVASSSLTIMLNTGSGVFRMAQYNTLPGSPWAIAAGDFNADGKLDLAWTDSQTQGTAANAYPIRCAFGVGNGTFGTEKVCYTTDGRPTGLIAADLNHDNKADLIVGIGPRLGADGQPVTGAKPRLATLLAKASSGFYWYSSSTSNGYPVQYQLQDLNGDGYPDVSIEAAYLYAGHAGGSFGVEQTLSIPPLPLFLSPLIKGGLPALFSYDSTGIQVQLNTSKK